MTLKNKDGSVYRLSGPNPAMKEQHIWTKFIVHNMKWKPHFRDDGTAIIPMESDLDLSPKTQSEVFLDELSSTKEPPIDYHEPIEDSKQEVEIKKEKIEQKSNPKEVKSSITKDIIKTFIYCLPAKIKEKKDDLYGDVFKTIQYEDPTSFEAVVISQTDMTIEMWSEAVYEKETILYPKNGDKRWWKVSAVQPKLGGWLIKGIPSQDQPSFES